MSALQETANLAQQYQNAYQTGQLSPQEYKELINDLQISDQINANLEEFQQNQQYHSILMGAIQLASAI
jgi:hypothetical protein